MKHLWLYRLALLLAVCTLFLVITGASVTSTEASSDYGHRTIASMAGLLTIVMAIALWRFDGRRELIILGGSAVFIVLAESVLGIFGSKLAGILHACLAQVFFALTAAIAVCTSPSWRRGPALLDDSGWPSIRSMAVSAPVLVLIQLVLGAGYRHKAFGMLPHITGAIFIAGFLLLFTVFVVSQFGAHAVLQRSAWFLMGILAVQVILGIAAYVAKLSSIDGASPASTTVLLTVAHVATGALTLAATVTLSIQIFRNVRPQAKLASGSLPTVS